MDLTITRIGAARFSAGRDGGRSAETALPVRSTARSDGDPVGAELVGDRALMRLENAVTTWARLLAEDLGVEIPIGATGLVVLTHNNRGATRDPTALPIAPASPLEQAAVWLACHPHDLRRHEAAHELLVDVRHAVAGLRAVVDRPIELRYLGPCPAQLTDGSVCAAELRAQVEATWVRCRRCRSKYEIARIQADARAAVEDELHTVANLVRLLGALGAPTPRRTVYRWAQDHRIEPRGWQHVGPQGVRITDHRIDERDTQVYRLGDALKLAVRERNKGGSAA
ncbi:hypothetical protein [Nocardia sp. NPDC046763]|uniref:hypothetical protein n=1 Tax=Nocardia sp. NPDC046763 TaxID=3155256 RepID=UPI003407E898